MEPRATLYCQGWEAGLEGEARVVKAAEHRACDLKPHVGIRFPFINSLRFSYFFFKLAFTIIIQASFSQEEFSKAHSPAPNPPDTDS